ncbi:wall-associated receptor kinase-like 9 [Pistacia vera]|uniref:wall-associated receptor kinase-like 9 n=1 Tax=Pistacia vera TaxID=55513 RepID=UPI001262CF29|nr:wall-associated receptor kinase-like 9 [Pistacia vera]
MAVHPHRLVLMFHIILLLWQIKASQNLCPNSCGNVKLSYPFGIGEGCYLDKWFEVTCDSSSGSPRAFLNSVHLELNETGHPYSSLIVNFPRNSSINLSASPFSFSNTDNVFTAIGCENYLNLSQKDSILSRCHSFCTWDPTQNDGCGDFLCNLTRNRKVDNLNISEIYSESFPRECSSAFVVHKAWLESNYLKNPYVLKDKEVVPAILEWGKYGGYCVDLYKSNTTKCNKDDYCVIKLNSDCSCLCDNKKSDSYIGCKGRLLCVSKNDSYRPECPYDYEPYQSEDGETWCIPSRSSDDIFIKKTPVKYIFGIGFSAGLGMVLLIIVTWWLYKFIQKRKAIKLKQKLFTRNGGNVEKTKLFTSKELEKATNNYHANRVLGEGGQGTVYKGMSEGRIIAIKKSKIVDESKIEEFINEVILLSQISHRNIVQLVGCCLETEVPLLVYEFVSNGNLFQHLHDQNEEFPFTWELRLRVAFEVSSVLTYLHSTASIPIYHRDIKSTNILLDEKFQVKLSDFGTSRSIAVDQTHLTTQVKGTFGYLDPEYFWSSQFTEKSDVYSFGVVLAELLTGQKPIRSTDIEEDRSLSAYFLRAMKENRLFEILDARVMKEGKKEEIATIANLTRKCLDLNGKNRPTMREVAIELGGIRASRCASRMHHINIEETNFVHGDLTPSFENS